ncbi:MAG: hypothetical protein M3P82_00555, partial [Bacteroidota bacterium]|nr:hypothetical protein [Bacteroidota bacterium]
MKKFFLILTITFLMLDYTSAQVELVDVKDPVYDFLKRMQLMNIIPSYNSSAVPVSRNAVAEYLLQIKHNIQKLTATDITILKDHEIDFEYDMYGTVNNQRNIFSKTGIRDLLNNNTQKHLYFHTDTNRTFFTDLSSSISLRNSTGDQYINSHRYTYRDDHRESPGENRRLHGELGVKLRGTLYNSVAFYLKFSKGHFENDDEGVVNESSSELLLNGNNSYIKKNENHNSFEGYLRYQTSSGWLALTFGRTQLNYGFGYIDKLFLSDNSAPFDFGKLDISYKAVSYSFTYGSIKGDSTGIYPEFSIRRLSSKNIATHMLNLT